MPVTSLGECLSVCLGVWPARPVLPIPSLQNGLREDLPWLPHPGGLRDHGQGGPHKKCGAWGRLLGDHRAGVAHTRRVRVKGQPGHWGQ